MLLSDKIRLLTVVFVIFTCSIVFADEVVRHDKAEPKPQAKEVNKSEQVPDKYEVQKGDTLWDISKKTFDSGFLWPRLWKENPEITNPNKITPGTTLKIPTEAQKQTVIQLPIPQEEIKQALIRSREDVTEKQRGVEIVGPQESQKVSYIRAEKNVSFPKTISRINETSIILIAGYIVKDLKTYGKILKTPEGRSFIGNNDYVYVKTDTDRFKKYYIVRKLRKENHPMDKKYLGELVSFVGALEITGHESGYQKAMIIASYGEIYTDDLLIPFFDLEPSTDSIEKPYLGGLIVDTSRSSYSTQLDLLYLDKGLTDGISPGDIFTVYSKGDIRQQIGKFKVVSVQQNTSAAYIIQSSSEINISDTF